MESKQIPMRTSGKFCWLDLFRFIAALVVVIVHARGVAFVAFGDLPSDQKSIVVAAFYLLTRIGNEAVVAFFVLSGFFVGGRAFERMANGKFNPADYAVDRSVRILLPLIPALALTALVLSIQHKPLALGQLLANLFALQGILVDSYGGNAPLWSLAYEVWFYILTGVLGVWAASTKWRLMPSLLLVAIALVFTQLSPNYLICWLIGAVAYLRRPYEKSTLLCVSAIIVGVCAIACIQIRVNSVSVSSAWQASLQQWVPSDGASRILLSGALALLIQQIVLCTPVRRVTRVLEVLGTRAALFSYSLYLTHYPVLQLMPYLGLDQANEISVRSIVNFLLIVSCCLAVALFSYYLFERHTTAVREFLKFRLRDGSRSAT